MRRGKVDFSGVQKEICLAFTPEAAIGDYVLVHVGFALSVVDEDEAQRIFETLDEMATARRGGRRPVKFLDEYRDRAAADQLAQAIRGL